jgi:protein involved in polysaccharide export with SLBB domain
VIGHVTHPGPSPYRPSLTAHDYVGLAGGNASTGSMRGWKVVDPNGMKRKVGSSDIINPGETVIVPERFLSQLGKVLTPISAASTIIISIVALRR